MEACQENQTKHRIVLDQRFDYQMANLTSHVDQLASVKELVCRMEEKLNTSIDMKGSMPSASLCTQGLEKLLIELVNQMTECRQDRLKLQNQMQVAQDLIDQLGELKELISTMNEKINISIDMKNPDASDPPSIPNASSWTNGLEKALTELAKEMKECRQDQLELQTKVAQDQLDSFKSQVEVLERLEARLTTMDKKIVVSQVDSDASSVSSAASVGSWACIDAGRPCCFLPDTYFMVMTADDGEILVPAKKLFKGAEVIAANGKVIEVAHPPEQHRVDAVIELQAGQSFLVVSPDHRILIPGNKTVPLPD